MGVIKNLMVRVGANVGGVVKGMNSAKKSVKDYAQSIKATKEAHKVALQNVDRLGDKLGQMKSVYNTVKTATAGLDLGKPLSEQMVEAEKALTQIEARRKKIERELSGITSPRVAGSKRTAALQAELVQLANKSKMAVARMAELDRVADLVGQSNMGHASAAGLEKLNKEIIQTENELKVAQRLAEETGGKLKSMGSAAAFAAGKGIGQLVSGLKAVAAAAAQAAAAGVKKLGNGLKSLGASAWRRITALPGKLLQIGKSASSGAGGVGKMVKSIRNIGIVSLGLRVAGGMFGRLRSIISSYISTNEELNAATATLTNQMGQALEPAIRLVMAAMQQLMPVVQKVSSAVNAVLKSIIGEIGEVSYAMRSMGTYGFDQITKAEETGSTSTVEQEQSALVTKLTKWIEQLKKAFVAGDWSGIGKMLGDSANGAFDALNRLDVGKKLGTFVNNLTTTLHSLLSTVDFAGIGKTAANLLGDGMATIDWAKVGETIGLAAVALPTVILSFLQNTDWALVGNSVLTCLQSAMGVVSAWVKGVDWLQIGQSVSRFITETNWAGIAQSFHGYVSAAFGGVEFTSVGDLVAKGFNGVVNALHRVVTAFNWPGLAAALTQQINDVITGADWLKFGQTISQLVTTTLQTLRSTIVTFDWNGLGSGIADCINGLDWPGMLSELSGSVSDLLKGGLDLLIGFAQKLNWSKLGKDVWNGLTGVVRGIDWNGILSKAFELLGSAIGGASSMMTTYWATVATAMAKGRVNAWSYFKGFIDDAGGDVGKGILNAIKAAFTSVGTWINTNLWTPFKKGFETAFGDTGSTISAIFEDIPDELKKPINTIISTINSLISGVCSGINSMVKALNALSFDIPDWVPGIGGKTFGLSLKEITAPKIPMLAKGGIVTEPTTAIIGEQGKKEAVLPLEQNTEWMDKMADRINGNGSGGAARQPVIIQLLLGKRKLTEYVIEDINQITKATGVCPIRV